MTVPVLQRVKLAARVSNSAPTRDCRVCAYRQKPRCESCSFSRTLDPSPLKRSRRPRRSSGQLMTGVRDCSSGDPVGLGTAKESDATPDSGHSQCSQPSRGRGRCCRDPNQRLRPFVLHYAETFIAPPPVGACRISSIGAIDRKDSATIKACVGNRRPHSEKL